MYDHAVAEARVIRSGSKAMEIFIVLDVWGGMMEWNRRDDGLPVVQL